MKLFDKVAIVGIGLIGGSLGLAIKRNRLAGQVIGVSRSRKTLARARRNCVIDRGSQDMAVIRDADLVILAAPVHVILNRAREIARVIKDGCIVTDVGSTKEEIVKKLDTVFDNYIGSHPLAGSEKSGVAHADPGLFRDSLCIVTPTKNTSSRALKKIKNLWRRLGARTLPLSPEQHDRALAFVSHLPHLTAFSLISSVPAQYFPFAAGGLKDTTRIAASDSTLWKDIFLSNRKNILQAIANYEHCLSLLKSALKKQNRNGLNALLEQARKRRASLLRHQ